VDKHFIKKAKELVKIAVPSIATKEFGLLCVLTVLLVIRTFLSIYLAGINGKIVKAIVSKDFPKFVRRVSKMTSDHISYVILHSVIHRQFVARLPQ
jgi:hypothetical protein